MRSLFINLELMLRIEDAAFAAHVRGYVDGEVARSTEITEEGYRAAPAHCSGCASCSPISSSRSSIPACREG